jgi:PAS domain-containing protein
MGTASVAAAIPPADTLETVPGLDPAALSERAEFIYRGRFRTIHVRTDRLFAGMLVVEWAAALAAAFLFQPGAPNGRLALLLGAAFALPPALLALALPGRPLTRHVVAIGQMLMSALLIHLSGGRMETHFHIFGSLAFLAFYRDWTVLATASAVTTLDNYYRGLYLPETVYGTTAPAPWRWLEHLAWVAFEAGFLIWASNQGAREMRAAAERQAQAEVTNDALARAKADLETANARLAESNRDTEERAREATASEAWFRALSSSSPLGIFEMNLQGAARYVNERFLSITGLPREATPGRTPFTPTTGPRCARCGATPSRRGGSSAASSG